MSTEGSNVSKLSGTMLLEKSPQDYNDICGDCHSLFQIRAMVHDESIKVSLATTAALDIHCLLEKQHQWFASFQEIGHDANSAEVSMNMEYQLDPHCERIPKEKGCGSSAPNFCNNAVARPFTCRSLAKLLVLVPSSSLLLGGRLGSSDTQYDTNQHVSKKVVILTSLVRDANAATTTFDNTARRCVVDQWLLNIAVPMGHEIGGCSSTVGTVGKRKFCNLVYSVKIHESNY